MNQAGPGLDLTALDEIITDQFGADQENLIMILQAAQKVFNYLPPEALDYVARRLDIPLSRVYSVATFYSSFSLEPRGKHIISVCSGTACHLKGSGRIADDLSRRLNVKPGQTTPDLGFTLATVNCLGACALAPVAVVDGKYQPRTDLSQMGDLVEDLKSELGQS